MSEKIRVQHLARKAGLYVRHYSEFWNIPSALSLRGITY